MIEHIEDEYADIKMMLEQIKLYYELDDNNIRKIKEEKIDRQLKRIDEEKKDDWNKHRIKGYDNFCL